MNFEEFCTNVKTVLTSRLHPLNIEYEIEVYMESVSVLLFLGEAKCSMHWSRRFIEDSKQDSLNAFTKILEDHISQLLQ